ncbi:unnamed protein product, partial [Porites evermanni]
MNKRAKDLNWSKLANASPKLKRLHLEEDDCNGLFHCPVQICNHGGFTTQRGCRKHVKNKHSWYYYFDGKPDSAQIDTLNVDETKKCEASDQKIIPRKSRAIASFDPTNNIARNFFSWLTGSGGGCKSDRQAQQIVSKCLKFCCEDEEELTFDIVDLSLCSPNLLFKFESVLKSCKEKPGAVLPIDLSFATKFLTVYLFIKVKGSRPVTYQYLTVEMVNKAKTNGGFIDQKMFKTAGKFGFDSLYLTETSMQVLDGYINHIRPLLRPTCDFVLVTRNGGQHNKLGELISKLVFDATGRYVPPTRYRQIVETASCRQLSSSAHSTIFEDEKNSSVDARVHYQKQRSRKVASKAHEYLEQLHGKKGSQLEIDVRSRLSGNSASSEDQNGSKTDTSSNEEGEKIRETQPKHFPARRKSLMFTPEEDNYLKAGIERHGYGQWKAILRDCEFHFQEGRTANSLLSHA